MQTKSPRSAHLIVAVVFTLSCIGLMLYAWLAVGGKTPLQPNGYELRILFPNASNLVENNDVRLAGVTVGKVDHVSHRQLNTVATITLQPRFAPLPSDAQAIIRNKTLLGETYIEITPGTSTARKLRDGALLPTRNVQPIQTIDQVLGSFDAPARRSFQRFVNEFAAGLHGRGADINSALGQLAPTAEDLNNVASTLDQQSEALTQILRDGSATFQQLGRRQASLRELIDAGDDVFATTKGRERQITATVRALPAFLTDVRRTLALADTTGQQADPGIRSLLPVARLLAPALRGARTLAPELRRTMRALAPLLPRLTPGVEAVKGLLRTATPLADAITDGGPQINPILELVAIYRDAFVSSFANLGAALQGSTPSAGGGRLHHVRGIPLVTNEDVFGDTKRLGSNRYNPYPAPGSMLDLATGLRSLSCRHESNPNLVPVLGPGAPPCLEAQPWTFQGKSSLYPHVQAGK